MGKKTIFKIAVPLVLIGVALLAFRGKLSSSGSSAGGDSEAVFAAQRGDLVIDVLEGGNIHAVESLEIRNEVKVNAGTKILKIIEEGYEITEDDVRDGKILVHLDASPIEEEIVDHDVEFQETEAAYAEAKQNIEVQASESTSEIKLVRQLARFALLDFEKFVGNKAAGEILETLDLPFDAGTLEKFEREADEMIDAAFNTAFLVDDVLGGQTQSGSQSTEIAGDAGDAKSPGVDGAEDSLSPAEKDEAISAAAAAALAAVEQAEQRKAVEAAAAAEAGIAAVPVASSNVQNGSLAAGVDFAAFLETDRLGDGEAEQTIRRMQDEALVARTEMAVVAESVEGAIRLHEENFITTTTLENEKVALEKAKLTVKTAETELDLFRDYEFPKEAEKMLSVFEEALLELVRKKREAMAQGKQAESQFRSRKRRYELEMKKREDLQVQLDSCVVRAKKPGLVAYGGGNDNYYNSRYYEAISEGAALKTGQPIITIPDMAKLAVDVQIHESHIKKIHLGQKALITVDAVPDQTLTGTVSKVAVLPDSNASRYNPSLKVYPSTITIEGAHEWLKPGMNAKVEIIVNELDDVVYIPVQSIFVEDDRHYVFVDLGGTKSRRPVIIGEHNDEFIEIVDGVEEGESILLNTPIDYEPGDVLGAVGPAAQLSSADSKGEDEA